MMKALLLYQSGRLDSLQIGTVDQPKPVSGELLIRVHAASLNPVDYKLALSGYPTWTYPFILGLDVAGTVEGIGAGVDGWQTGDRVAYHGDLSRPGGFAEYAVIPAHVVARIPEGVSFEDAAALPCAGMTAYQSLYRKATLRAGLTALIQGGAGAVGGFATQLATQDGVTVITTASRHNHEYVKSLGAAHAIDYREEDVSARVREITDGRGVDIIVDTISAESAARGLDLLAFNGHLVCVADTPQPKFDRAISVHEVNLGGAHLHGDVPSQRDLAVMMAELLRMVDEKRLDPMVTQTIGLDDIPAALEALRERHVRGKIVAKIDPSL